MHIDVSRLSSQLPRRPQDERRCKESGWDTAAKPVVEKNDKTFTYGPQAHTGPGASVHRGSGAISAWKPDGMRVTAAATMSTNQISSILSNFSSLVYV